VGQFALRIAIERQPMRLDQVLNWLNNTMSEQSVPQMFGVLPPEIHADQERFRGLDMRVNRRPDSGVLEMRFNRSDNPGVTDPVQTAMSIAQEEDPERKFLELRRVHEESEFLVSRTLIDSLPVLGPGGQVLIQDSDAAFMADITIRKPDFRGIASEEWSDPESVYRSLMADFGVYRDYLKIKARLGYFELSKYDDQSLIRPVFIFLIQSSERSNVDWETTRVQPATLNKSIAEREGLGVSE
jgi:hypothetical protein